MLSRVAENLYWIGRYVERAKNMARLLDDGFHLELDSAGLVSDAGGSSPVISILTMLACQEAFARKYPNPERDTVLRFLTFDRGGGNSILAMIARARENARASQETLSTETWGQVNQLYLSLSGPRAKRRFQASPFRFFNRIKRACVLFDGLVDSTLPRTEVYHFLQLGRYLERVDQISRIVNVKFLSMQPVEDTAEMPLRTLHLTSLLRCCSAYEAYLKEQHDRIEPKSVVGYLVLEADFPYALRFCIARCVQALRAISGDDDEGTSQSERLLGRVDSELRYLDIEEIFSRGLTPFFTGIQDACHRVDQAIRQEYFFS